ncbi:hypothetical protein [Burkholderia gladioli]|uniref:hypothetical protein n=1 Tax=Burkholderia gladioli TaxID=28095 RepID=UPI0016411A4B|nr:hypothetical protein [Burkholderia gladioli]
MVNTTGELSVGRRAASASRVVNLRSKAAGIGFGPAGEEGKRKSGEPAHLLDRLDRLDRPCYAPPNKKARANFGGLGVLQIDWRID